MHELRFSKVAFLAANQQRSCLWVRLDGHPKAHVTITCNMSNFLSGRLDCSFVVVHDLSLDAVTSSYLVPSCLHELTKLLGF